MPVDLINEIMIKIPNEKRNIMINRLYVNKGSCDTRLTVYFKMLNAQHSKTHVKYDFHRKLNSKI